MALAGDKTLADIKAEESTIDKIQWVKDLSAKHKKAVLVAESFDPTTSADWTVAPTDKSAALDELAERVADVEADVALITPVSVVKFSGKHTSVADGGGVNAVTVTGVAATDVVIATLQTKGSTPRTLLTSAPTLNTITFTFSGDPSTDHIVSYMVLR